MKVGRNTLQGMRY